MIAASSTNLSPDCYPGWVPTPPNASWGQRCYKLMEYTSTFADCITLCGADASPPCIANADEAQYLLDGVVEGFQPWIR